MPLPPPPPPPPFFSSSGDDDDACLGCTPDELAAIVREIQDSGLICSHTYHLVSYKNTFVGRDLVTWLVEKKGYKSEWKSLRID